jgi:RNA polymerase-binding transcription factor DksA
MTAESVRRLLTADRAATLDRIAEMTAELGEVIAASAGGNLDDEHDPEGPTVAFERAQLIAVLGRSREHLTDVDHALAALATGRYGRCERCDARIDEDRLAAVPAARRCIACASRR